MSKKLPALKPKTIVKALLRAGFFIHNQKGSHVHLRHPIKTHLRITIPYHQNFDIPLSIIDSIIKQAEMSTEEFLDLL